MEAAPHDIILADGWRLRLGPAAFELTRDGTTESIVFPREQALEGIERWGLDFTPGFFVVRGPKRRRFKVRSDQASMIKAWLGPDYRPELRHLVQRRLKSAIPLALLLVAMGPHLFNWILAALMVGAAVLGRFRPTHYVFLIDAAAALAIAFRQATSAAGDGGWFPGVLAVVVFLFAFLNLDMFRRFHTALRAGR